MEKLHLMPPPPFTIQHAAALAGKKGGLLIFCQNEIRDKPVNLVGKVLTPSAARDKPLIKLSCIKESDEDDTPTKDTSSQEKTEQKAACHDLFWHVDSGQEAGAVAHWIHPSLTDADARSHSKHEPAKVTEQLQEKEKKRKDSAEACLERHCHFPPFVFSMDGLLGREAKTFSKSPAAKLANKWEKSHSQACGCFNARLSMAIVGAMHLCTRGSRVPVHKISIRYPQWEDGAGLSLFECWF
jgi:hypothetical protein